MEAINRLKASGLTRIEIARRLPATRQAVGHWERGRGSPSPKMRDRLIAIARERGITLLAEDFQQIDGDTKQAA